MNQVNNSITQKKIFCVSSGQKVVKKNNSKIHKKNMYLNYGLLSLATILKENQYSPLVIHGHFKSTTRILQTTIENGLDESPYPVLVSIPSFYAVSWANEFITLIKQRNPEKIIIVGGRWVIDDEIKKTKQLIPQADLIVAGLAETKIVNTIEGITNNNHILVNTHTTSLLSKLDYSLLHNRYLYNPSIEVSRGCGMGCSFCQEKNEKLTNLKPANEILREVTEAIQIDDLPPMNIYFETSLFAPTEQWVDELLIQQKNHELFFCWRTEARVDSIKIKLLKRLYNAGLRVVDLGLESASPMQLKRMKKSANPISYLEKASKFIKSAYDAGIMVKVNVLLSAGETLKTLKETTDWLDQHKTFIKGVSVGPVIVFGWENKNNDYITEIKNLGASISHIDTTGVTHIHLSKEIDYVKSIKLSTEISRRYMSAKDYYDLKRFCYFARDYTFKDFMRDLKSSSKEYLNFSL